MKDNNKLIHIDENIKKYSWDIYNELKGKYSRASFWYISLSIISLLLTAILIFANLWAIRWNPLTFDKTVKTLFFASVMINAIAALLTTFISFFELRPKAKYLERATLDIDREYKLWRKKEGKYANKDADIIIIDTINEISRRTS